MKTFEMILGLLGGLALFLYGMQMMSDGLEDAAGNRMKKIVEKLTSNRFLGVAVGTIITAVIQSSSATTVMVVGFVNSGMMTLKQAVWIIMGANIGTTITGQLIALDMGMIAPLIAFIGVVMLVFLKMPQVKHVGKILAGLGVLFIGMDMMSAAMTPLREVEAFRNLMTTFTNPLVGILIGAVFTALIQSSSAAVGILQALAGASLIGYDSSVYVLFGMTIGTCITAALASVGTSVNAKRAAIIHLLFNIIGTAIFTVMCEITPIADFVGNWTPDNPVAQIANMHTFYKIATTVILLPFGAWMVFAAEKILPDKSLVADGEQTIASLTEEFRRGRINLGSIAMHTEVLSKEIEQMIRLAGENANRCFQTILDTDETQIEKIRETEEKIDSLNKTISQFISKILVHNNSGQSVYKIEKYFVITGNAERIGDHALNIGGYVDVIKQKQIKFSDSAKAEIKEMQAIVNEAIEKVLQKENYTYEVLIDIAAIEQKIDDMTMNYREYHLERMRQGKCSEEACVLYSEMLTDFERMGDHVLNIAQAYSKIYAA